MTVGSSELRGEGATAPGSPRWASMWLGLAVGALLLSWVALRVDLPRVWSLLFTVHPGWLASAVVVKLAAIPVKAQRWKVVLGSVVDADLEKALRATWLGYAGNVVLPMRLGELVRIRVLQRHNPRVRFGSGLGSVVVERVIDGTLILGLFALTGLFTIRPSWAEEGAVAFGGLFAAGLTVLFVLARFGRERVLSISWLPRRVARFLAGFLEGLELLRLRRPHGLAMAILLSGLAWSLEIAGSLCLLEAGGLELGWAEAAFLTTAVALGLTAPSAPAGLGTHQFVYVSVLGILGVSVELATALSLLGMTAVGLALLAVALPLIIRESSEETAAPRRLGGETGRRLRDGATAREHEEGNASSGHPRNGVG